MSTVNRIMVLDEFIIQKQKEFPYATGELSGLLRDIGLAAKIVNREVNKAGLVDILGAAGTTNVQGEEVKKLDVFANDTFINCLKMSGLCAGIASEEDDDIIIFDQDGNQSHYVVCMDPLDGSSNIDVNVSIGTIFSIYRRKTTSGNCNLEDFLQPGSAQVAAGYVVYGSSTMLVYTTGHGVNGFTLDPGIGEFYLSHPNITTTPKGNTYSLNQGNYTKFPQGVKDYVDHCLALDGINTKPYSLRYIGSMVADLHRNLIKGGIFIYPPSADAPKGKLRLLYECNPMSFIVEQAGGRATDGHTRILDLKPEELHQRTPIFIGSSEMVKQAEQYYQKYAQPVGA
ncbi:MAG: class 1 fructose-bisphosphatase [Chitinophagales bacterium]|nr:class 1 fructose-bisphosphatase [Chitinophagales bacterium]